MTASALKSELHKAIDNIKDSAMLEAIYSFINKKTDVSEYELSEKEWAEIEHRQLMHKQGKSKSYAWEDVKKMVNEGLNK